MKASEIEGLVTAYADGLEAAKAPKIAANLRVFAGALKEFPDMQVAEFAEAVSKCQADAKKFALRRRDKARVVDVLPHLSRLKELVFRVPNGEAASSEIGLLIQSLEDDSVYLVCMLEALKALLSGDPPPDNARVADFIKRLKTDMGRDEFEQTLSELTSSNLKREQVYEIALAVYGGLPKSTSRRAALGFIRKPHDAKVRANKGINASRGRSAA